MVILLPNCDVKMSLSWPYRDFSYALSCPYLDHIRTWTIPYLCLIFTLSWPFQDVSFPLSLPGLTLSGRKLRLILTLLWCFPFYLPVPSGCSSLDLRSIGFSLMGRAFISSLTKRLCENIVRVSEATRNAFICISFLEKLFINQKLIL